MEYAFSLKFRIEATNSRIAKLFHFLNPAKIPKKTYKKIFHKKKIIIVRFSTFFSVNLCSHYICDNQKESS